MIKINEIFLSIQGESSFSGRPCIFIRLTGCNLRCNYCDTTYSYDEGSDFSIDDILDIVNNYSPVKLVEITGGEPLLQKEVLALIERLNADNYNILLETNGSQLLKNVPNYVHKIVDIKCPGSGEGNSFLNDNLNYLDRHRDELKFVLSNREDYDWVKMMISKLQLQQHNILISVVFNRLLPRDVVQWIVDDRLNVRFQLQLHKYIWEPDKRGV